MISRKQLATAVISPTDLLYVNRLRKYLGDTVELNTLKEVQESTDSELHMALYDTLDEINFEFIPETSYTQLSEWRSWPSLRDGAILNILIMKGILSARNTLTYNDAGGIQVSDMDVYGRYLQYFNMIQAKFRQSVATIKRNQNIEDCYGGVASEYSYLGGYDN